MGRHRNYGGSSGLPPETKDAVLSRTLTLSAAQILALSGTPITIVTTPGPGQVFALIGSIASLNFGTIAYTGASNLFVAIGNPAQQNWMEVMTNAGVKSAVSLIQQYNAAPVIRSNDVPANMADKPLVVCVDSTNFAAGDSQITLTVFYAVAPTA